MFKPRRYHIFLLNDVFSISPESSKTHLLIKVLLITPYYYLLLHLNQWKNTQEVIDWFKGVNNKQHYKFIMFDIKDFYLSISKELLTDALAFAETIINIDDHDKKIIYHSSKSLLFNQEKAWMKKRSDLFDVSMGAYDGAEV